MNALASPVSPVSPASPTSTTAAGFGVITEPATLTISRLLPGSLERVWAYLTDGELRRRWLASGAMQLLPGAAFELVWHNDELTTPPGTRPEGFGPEHRMPCRITALEPMRRLAFSWSDSGDVSFELEPQPGGVLLTVTHRRLPNRDMMLMVGAGWHAHLDVLLARLAGREPQPFWDQWQALRSAYDVRLPAS